MPSVKFRPSFWDHDHCTPLSIDLAPTSIFERHRHYLCFDIETKGPAPNGDFSAEALSKLGCSVACAWDSKDQQMHTYFEKDLPKLFELMQDRLLVGHNIIRFDLPVLAGYGLKTEGLDTFDTMVEIGRAMGRRFVKLEYVAQATLGEGKSADGLMAIEWFKQGRFKELAEYCARDVEVTNRVFRHGLEKKFIAVQYPEHERQEAVVDWS